MIEATATDDNKHFAVGGAYGAKVGLAGSVTVDVLTSSVLAYIGDGAQINEVNSVRSANQEVRVHATHDNNVLSVAGAVAGSKTAGLGLAVNTHVIDKTTNAYIHSSTNSPTTVQAKNDVSVQSESTESMVNVAAGFALSAGEAQSSPALVRSSS